MKKCLPLVVAFLLPFHFSNGQTDSVLARQFVQLNADGAFQKAYQLFAPQLQSRLNPGLLKSTWNKYMGKYGTLQDIHQMELIAHDSVRIWMTDCSFTDANIRLALTFNKDKELIGYYINRIEPHRISTARRNETDTTIAVPGGKIAGSLVLPNKQQAVPVVLILPGSGSVDRDGNAPPVLETNTYRMLADGLAADGIASFRYDKRGTGQSSQLVTHPERLRFADFVRDAVDLIGFLKQDTAFSEVILAGHSQGSLIAILAAQQVEVAGVISLEGAGQPVDKILYQQISRLTKDSAQQLAKVLDSIKAGIAVKSAPNSPLFNPTVQPFLTSWMQFDPAKEIGQLPMPVLIINGTTDLQVPVEQADLLAKAAQSDQKVIIEGMNHELKTAPAERTLNLSTYQKPGLPLHKELMPVLVTFINSL